MLTKEIINIDIEQPKTLILSRIAGENIAFVYCTQCGEYSLKNKYSYSNKEVYCYNPDCKNETQAHVLDRWCYTSVLNNIRYSYISNIKYSSDYFEITILNKEFVFTIDQNENDELSINENIQIDEKEVKIIYKYEKLKTKNEYRFKKYISLDNEVKTLKKSDLDDNIYHTINKLELIKLKLCPANSSTVEMIWSIFKTYSDFNDLLKYEVAAINCARENRHDYIKLISYLESSEFYRKKVQEKIDNNIKSNLARGDKASWYETIYIYNILNDLPYKDEFYYKLLDKYLANREYYTLDINEHYLKMICKYFVDMGYTEEEADNFLQAAYRQNYTNFWALDDFKKTKTAMEQIGIPFDKVPKEMVIYKTRGMCIYRYIANSQSNTSTQEIVYNNKIYKIDFDTNLDTIKKAISRHNNYSFVNKILYEYNTSNSSAIKTVKNTDYSISYKFCADEIIKKTYYEVVKIYDKDKLIEDSSIITQILEKVSVKEEN